jgi:hypothetical protein
MAPAAYSPQRCRAPSQRRAYAASVVQRQASAMRAWSGTPRPSTGWPSRRGQQQLRQQGRQHWHLLRTRWGGCLHGVSSRPVLGRDCSSWKRCCERIVTRPVACLTCSSVSGAGMCLHLGGRLGGWVLGFCCSWWWTCCCRISGGRVCSCCALRLYHNFAEVEYLGRMACVLADEPYCLVWDVG